MRLRTTILAALLFVCVCSVGAAPRYVVTALFPRGCMMNPSYAFINDSGQVVFGDQHNSAFWEKGVITRYILNFMPRAINDLGQVVGVESLRYGFLWQASGESLNLGSPGSYGFNARDLNERGEVVGASNVDHRDHAYLWKNGEFHRLDGADAVTSQVFSINDSGVAVGYVQTKSSLYPAIWKDGDETPLDVSGQRNWTPIQINNRGQILGRVGTQPCLWQDGTWEYLPLPEGVTSAAPSDMNDLGQIVGRTTNGATLWENGTVVNLPECVPPELRLGLSYATGINNFGQIVGTCWVSRDEAMLPILLTPILTVEVDIKPGESFNTINLKSHGITPVAVLTTHDFDAATIDPATIEFAGTKPVKWTMEDINSDGRPDMLFHFRTQDLNLTAAGTEATLSGAIRGGQNYIEGRDSVRIVGGGR